MRGSLFAPRDWPLFPNSDVHDRHPQWPVYVDSSRTTVEFCDLIKSSTARSTFSRSAAASPPGFGAKETRLRQQACQTLV
jgi:hypothetical protein